MGWDPAEAERATKKPFGFDPEDAAEWSRAGLTPAEAVVWEDQPEFFPPEEAGLWKRAGFTPEEATAWAPAGPMEAKRLVDKGVSLQDSGPALAADHRAFPEKQGSFRRAFASLSCAGSLGYQQHELCNDLKKCSCSCHCWHDGRQYDEEQQGPEAGTNPPHFVRSTERTAACRSTKHEDCRAWDRCRCQCHCWHHRWSPSSSDNDDN
jgi:hypothetical protein